MISRAKKLDTFFKILRRILLVCIIVELCVMVVLTIANAAKEDIVIGEDLNELDIGAVTFVLHAEHTPSNAAILCYSWACIAPETIAGAALYVALGYIRKLLSPMKEGRPFHRDAVRWIRKLAFLSLGLGIVKNIADVMETFLGLRTFGLNSFSGEGFIQAVRADYSWDFSYIVVFFVLLLMACIFSYGIQLQQLSDETL